MKILLTGGGTGGHFYPLIAVAEEIRAIVKEKKLLHADMYYMSDTPYNKSILFDHGIEFVRVPCGKYRRYFSLQNITDIFKTAWGVVYGLYKTFEIYPDVVFAKGGYASFPAVCAARILRIPVVMHESDSAPGKVNEWTGKFAKYIALSYPDAGAYFPKDKVAWTGNPIRKDILIPTDNGAFETLQLEQGVPVITVLGGSQGSQIINDIIINLLPQLLREYQIVHQTGTRNIKEVQGVVDIVVKDTALRNRYKPFEYLNPLMLRMAAGISSLVITRAGSTLFEVAAWGLPSIVIPITSSNGDHQRKNAFSYARNGAGLVIEENNLTQEILYAQIQKIMSDPLLRERMTQAARDFAKLGAARTIAEGVISIAIEHEK